MAIVVHDYDPAIRFFVDVLGFELLEDSPAVATDGRPKRWVVVRPPGAQTGLLLARADGERQAAVVGDQHAGRVGFFLRVDDFGAQYERMVAAGVEFVRPPRTEPYGQVAVFLDIAGNRWDLLGPAACSAPFESLAGPSMAVQSRLAEVFGEEYARYQERVRRWLLGRHASRVTQRRGADGASDGPIGMTPYASPRPGHR